MFGMGCIEADDDILSSDDDFVIIQIIPYGVYHTVHVTENGLYNDVAFDHSLHGGISNQEYSSSIKHIESLIRTVYHNTRYIFRRYNDITLYGITTSIRDNAPFMVYDVETSDGNVDWESSIYGLFCEFWLTPVSTMFTGTVRELKSCHDVLSGNNIRIPSHTYGLNTVHGIMIMNITSGKSSYIKSIPKPEPDR